MTAWGPLAVALVLAVASGAVARADDPKLAPGRDPAGAAVAVIADGFDYTRADVADVLARDGEGEAIAWDAVDGDHRPFKRDGKGTDAVLAAGVHGGVRVVAVRVVLDDAGSLARGLAFAAATPARFLVVPLDAGAKAGLDVLKAAAQRFEAVLLVGSVPKLADGDKAEDLPNLIVLDAGANGLAAAEAVARVLGCNKGALAGASGAELKTAFLARLDEKALPRCAPQGGEEGKQR
ncbi:hypothetical protein [Hyphomicrobium sp.]|uniref:hypothetical protein n=1 Tax=Hyphomicrobium sp. TaxID=82 RepID=UPI0025BBAC97|nr:hypothetical protein [Hyphomicrobium sp.]MCC7250595.1 hypothetical protein [Hyphomicrobium sp.]